LHQLPKRAFAASTLVKMPSRRVTVSSSLAAKAGPWRSCQGALAGVDLGHQLIGVGERGVQIVVKRVVLSSLPALPLPSSRSVVILSSRSTAELARL